MNKKIVILSAAFIMTAGITPAFAQLTEDQTVSREQQREQRGEDRQQIQTLRTELKDNVQAKRAEIAQKRLEFQDKKEKMAQDKCKNIEAKIATRAGRYENNSKMLQKVYGNMKTRLDRLSVKLKSAGADTTTLEADLAILYGKINKLNSDQAAFLATLSESQNFVCEKTEGEFKVKMDQARKVPELIKQDRQDIKNFFQTTIKTDLQAIRKSVASTTTETEQDKVKAAKKTEATVAPTVATQPSTTVTTETVAPETSIQE